MKILITSDIHGQRDKLKQVIKKHADVDFHIDCGDLCLDQNHSETQQIITVKGNNDFYSLAPYERVVDLKGLKIYMTHGHLQHVKFGLDRLIKNALSHHADLCVFGHTHQRYLNVKEKMIICNPGALSGYDQSYALYHDGQITFYKL